MTVERTVGDAGAPQHRSHRLPCLLTLADTVEFFNLVTGVRLTADEKEALTAFLMCL